MHKSFYVFKNLKCLYNNNKIGPTMFNNKTACRGYGPTNLKTTNVQDMDPNLDISRGSGPICPRARSSICRIFIFGMGRL